ncbi:MAG: class I SAM-dependent methyltransferase [Bacteroidota bacterium]
MTLNRDPENNESKALRRHADFDGRRVLEIGCGEGRLTWKYAGAASHVTGIEIDLDALKVARVDCPAALQNRVSLAAASAYHLPFPDETFDIAILAWSL